MFWWLGVTQYYNSDVLLNNIWKNTGTGKKEGRDVQSPVSVIPEKIKSNLILVVFLESQLFLSDMYQWHLVILKCC